MKIQSLTLAALSAAVLFAAAGCVLPPHEHGPGGHGRMHEPDGHRHDGGEPRNDMRDMRR